MSKVFDVISGIGMLIAIFLFLSRGSQTVAIIKALASTSISGIRTLQGR